MEEKNKDILFQGIGALIIILGMYTKNEYILLVAGASICIAAWYWYAENLAVPIESLQKEIKDLRKDLNMRKEIEDIRLALYEVKRMIKNKQGGLNPFLFIILLIVIIMIMMYLRDKGLI